MQFTDTQTFINLARSFAGESQAGMRYQLIATMAKNQGYKALSDIIRTLAKNETNHARMFFEAINTHAGNCDNINLGDAGYPFRSGTLEENLNFASLDEDHENKLIYPDFMKTAQQEGFGEIADLYNRIAKVEGEHKIIFEYLYNAFKDGTLYKTEQPTLWVCSECGHRATTKEAWNICPLCKQSQGYVEIHLPFKKENI